MGRALFEGFVVGELFKAFANADKRPAAYYWRSQGGLEVDLINSYKSAYRYPPADDVGPSFGRMTTLA